MPADMATTACRFQGRIASSAAAGIIDVREPVHPAGVAHRGDWPERRGCVFCVPGWVGTLSVWAMQIGESSRLLCGGRRRRGRIRRCALVAEYWRSWLEPSSATRSEAVSCSWLIACAIAALRQTSSCGCSVCRSCLRSGALLSARFWPLGRPWKTSMPRFGCDGSQGNGEPQPASRASYPGLQFRRATSRLPPRRRAGPASDLLGERAA